MRAPAEKRPALVASGAAAGGRPAGRLGFHGVAVRPIVRRSSPAGRRVSARRPLFPLDGIGDGPGGQWRPSRRPRPITAVAVEPWRQRLPDVTAAPVASAAGAGLFLAGRQDVQKPIRRRRRPDPVDGPYVASPRPKRVDDEARFNAEVLATLNMAGGTLAFLRAVGAL